ncbi:MAG: helix-turn-helix domain containing protein [Candidatus Obscuribacterales bacterium]|jgi:AcrR family transcriptional regulator|nr:helix-turn-helix domain containing protein [Candidatus Obscuribacterales bacterium]
MARPKVDVNRAQNIIEAADELFARYGFERTSMDDIAKHSGIGKGSIYLEFRTKEEILFRILERYAVCIEESFKAKLNDQKRSPLAVLREAYIEESINCYDRVTRDIHTPETLLHTSIAMKKHFAAFYVRRRKLLHELLIKAAKAGEIKKSRATDETALALMMAVSTLFPPYFDNFSESAVIKNRQDLIDRGPALVDLLIAGLKS